MDTDFTAPLAMIRLDGMICIFVVAAFVVLGSLTRRAARSCRRCGAVTRPGARFCAQCGQVVGE